MSQTLWLLLRAVLAITLMIGFYVLAVVVMGVLLWIPYAAVAYAHILSVKLSLLCVIGAFSIFFAILPTRDVFEPPGPLVTERDEPRLFAFIRQVADDMGQKMPREVYVLADANAWVTQRGGVMGIGGRRVMGIGLPLLQALSVSEFRAVLAHEFGHFAAKDVILGPWIHKTYAAIRRTMQDAGHFALFKWYGALFLRVMYAISRRQELIADQLAARVAGAPVLAHALRRTSTLGASYQAYFQNEVSPVVQAGFLPPVAQGFDQFLRSDLTRKAARMARKMAEHQVSSDAFDSHPPLLERMAALGCAEDNDFPEETTDHASSLLDRADVYMTALLQREIGEERLQRLRLISWDEVGQSIHLKRWQSVMMACGPALLPFTFETLPLGKEALTAAAPSWAIDWPPEARNALTLTAIECAVSIRLVANGWRPHVRPGEQPVFVKGDARCFPRTFVNELISATATRERWLEQCTSLNLSGPLVDLRDLVIQESASAEPPASSERARRRRRGW